jgi:hypothetical protein
MDRHKDAGELSTGIFTGAVASWIGKSFTIPETYQPDERIVDLYYQADYGQRCSYKQRQRRKIESKRVFFVQPRFGSMLLTSS